MATYVYTKPYASLRADQLVSECVSAGLPVVDCQRVGDPSETIWVITSAALTAPQKTTLDTTVSNHSGFTAYGTYGGGVPTGTVIAWAGSTVAPGGWLYCQGQAVSRTTYAALFDVCGTTWGAGDGSTTFNVPSLSGRFPMAPGGPGNPGAIGTAGGVGAVTLGVANLPAHNHVVPGRTRTGSVTANANEFERGDPTSSADLNTGFAGSNTPFSVLNYYLSINFLIKT